MMTHEPPLSYPTPDQPLLPDMPALSDSGERAATNEAYLALHEKILADIEESRMAICEWLDAHGWPEAQTVKMDPNGEGEPTREDELFDGQIVPIILFSSERREAMYGIGRADNELYQLFKGTFRSPGDRVKERFYYGRPNIGAMEPNRLAELHNDITAVHSLTVNKHR